MIKGSGPSMGSDSLITHDVDEDTIATCHILASVDVL